MAAPGFLTVKYTSGNQTGVIEDVPISTAESLCMMGSAQLVNDTDEALDPDPVFDPGPALDV